MLAPRTFRPFMQDQPLEVLSLVIANASSDHVISMHMRLST